MENKDKIISILKIDQLLSSKRPMKIRKERRVFTNHGIELSDDYYWLKNKESEEVIQFLESENLYAASKMDDTKELQDFIYKEIKGRLKETDESVPVKLGEYFYYNRTEIGKNYVIHCRKYQKLDNKEEIYLDENQLAEGHSYFDLGDLSISKNNMMMAYTIDTSGYEEYELIIKNIKTSEVLLDSIKKMSGSVIWHPNNKILYYGIHDDSHRQFQVMIHHIDQDSSEDKIILTENNDEFVLNFYLTRDDKFIILESEASDTTVVRYIPLESETITYYEFRQRIDGIEYYLTSNENYFYFLTNENAKNFKLLRVLLNDTSVDNYEEIISHKSNVTLMAVTAFEDFLVVLRRENSLRIFSILNPITNEISDINLDETISVVSFGSNPNFQTDFFRFSFSSLITPSSVVDYHVESGTLKLRKKESINDYDTSPYTISREFAPSRDGKKIPITLIHPRNLVKDGSNKLYLHAYGSYGVTLEPGFNRSIFSLLDRGIIYAIAHIRGSSMMGREWYLDGKLLNKKNTFNDFIDVSEYLIKTKYTNSSKLAIYGASAGGLLVGAVLNMRPELYQVAIARVPFVDVINTMLDSTIPLTSEEYREWGPLHKNKKYFEYMLSYSPYDNVNETDFPNLLVTAGLNDPRVHYWEPAKWIAKIREIKSKHNNIIFKTDMGSGHAGPSGRYNYIKEIAYIYAFVIKYLGT